MASRRPSWLGWVVVGRWREGAEGASVLGPDSSGSGRGGQFLKERAQVGPPGEGRSGICTQRGTAEGWGFT